MCTERTLFEAGHLDVQYVQFLSSLKMMLFLLHVWTQIPATFKYNIVKKLLSSNFKKACLKQQIWSEKTSTLLLLPGYYFMHMHARFTCAGITTQTWAPEVLLTQPFNLQSDCNLSPARSAGASGFSAVGVGVVAVRPCQGQHNDKQACTRCVRCKSVGASKQIRNYYCNYLQTFKLHLRKAI